MSPKKYLSIFSAIFILILATLACTMNVGGPDYPDAIIPVSTQAAESLKTQLTDALKSGVQGGTIILTITETQITSYLALKLEAQEDPLFTEPQVYLRDGQMQIYGRAHQGYFVANVGIMVSVGIDVEGQPTITITSADFGPFPAPEGLTSSLAAIIKEAYTGAVGPVATGFRIENIIITDGFIVMSGQVK